MTRDEVVQRIEDAIGEMALEENDVILFDGMEDAFLGVAERFEPITRVTVNAEGETDSQETGGEHSYFAVYSYQKMIDILVGPSDDMTHEEAVEYLEFNTVGLYAGPGTPAIMRDEE